MYLGLVGSDLQCRTIKRAQAVRCEPQRMGTCGVVMQRCCASREGSGSDQEKASGTHTSKNMWSGAPTRTDSMPPTPRRCIDGACGLCYTPAALGDC